VLADRDIPVLIMESYTLDDMDMTPQLPGYFGNTDGHDRNLTIHDPIQTIVPSLSDNTPLFAKDSVDLKWGKPGPGGHVMATLPEDEQKAVVFSYDLADSMIVKTDNRGNATDATLAPARRFFFGINTGSMDCLSEQGWALLMGSVEWLLEAPQGAIRGDVSGGKSATVAALAIKHGRNGISLFFPDIAGGECRVYTLQGKRISRFPLTRSGWYPISSEVLGAGMLCITLSAPGYTGRRLFVNSR
jgi:hypothetical protein